MSRHVVPLSILVGLALALGALVWMTRPPERPAPAKKTAAPPPPAPTSPSPTVRVAPGGRPALFGRARKGKGPGSLVARVLEFGSGRGLAGAPVLLAGADLDGHGVRREDRTAEDGSLILLGVPAGAAYSLRIEVPGRREDRVLEALTVAEGEVTDLGTLWLGSTARLRGTVVGADGAGVAGATVEVHGGSAVSEAAEDFGRMVGQLDRVVPAETKATTDGSGRFEVEELAAGPWTLVARAAGRGQATARVVLPPDGSASPDVRIVLAPGGTVAGHVVDEAGQGVAGARVAGVPGDEPDAFLLGRVFTETGPEGEFVLDASAQTSSLVGVVAAEGFPTTFATLRVGDRDARIVLRRTVPLSVTVRTAQPDVPLAGAEVLVEVGDRADPNEQPGSIVSGTTDANGTVVLDVRPGMIQMALVTHVDHAPGSWGSAPLADRPWTMEGPDDPGVGERGGEVTFRLPADWTISGRVTGPDGEGIPGAQVLAFGMTRLERPVVTGADGRYRIRSARLPGEGPRALLRARALGFVQPDATMAVRETPDASGAIEHDIPMARASVVTGRVLDASGVPAAGARVRLAKIGPGAGPPGEERFTGEDGGYLLEAEGGGTVQVLAQRAGSAPGASPAFPLRAGATEKAPDTVLPGAGELEVRVRGPSGTPVAGARATVEVLSRADAAAALLASMTPPSKATTDAQGVAVVGDLSVGPVEVTVRAAGFAPAVARAEIGSGAGSRALVDVRMGEGVHVSGLVTDEHGASLPGARVRVLSNESGGDSWTPEAETTVDEAGRFRLEDLPDFPSLVEAVREGYRTRYVRIGRVRDGIQVKLTPVDAAAAEKKRALQAELNEVWVALAGAKTEADRAKWTALAKEIAERLSAWTDDTTDPPEASDEEPPR